MLQATIASAQPTSPGPCSRALPVRQLHHGRGGVDAWDRAAVILAGDEAAVLAESGLGRADGVDLGEDRGRGPCPEPSSAAVDRRQARPPAAELLPQHAVLFPRVLGCPLLPLVESPGEEDGEDVEGRVHRTTLSFRGRAPPGGWEWPLAGRGRSRADSPNAARQRSRPAGVSLSAPAVFEDGRAASRTRHAVQHRPAMGIRRSRGSDRRSGRGC